MSGSLSLCFILKGATGHPSKNEEEEKEEGGEVAAVAVRCLSCPAKNSCPPLCSLVCPLCKWAHQFLTRGRVERQKEGGHVAERVRRERVQERLAPSLRPSLGTTDGVWRCLCGGLSCAWSGV